MLEKHVLWSFKYLTPKPCFIKENKVNQFQPSVAFHKKPVISGFYMKRKTELKWVEH